MIVFLDESGDMNFSATGSRFYIFTIAILQDPIELLKLQNLRHELALEGYSLPHGFHAQKDPSPRRRRVLNTISSMNFRLAAVALEKRKAYPRITNNPMYFYKLGCYFLLRWLFLKRDFQHPTDEELGLKPPDDLLIIASEFGTADQKKMHEENLAEVASQYRHGSFNPRVCIWQAKTDLGLQLADYCAWAVQRHLELTDETAQEAMAAISDKFVKIMQPFEKSTETFY